VTWILNTPDGEESQDLPAKERFFGPNDRDEIME
jgi:hypothetical protein